MLEKYIKSLSKLNISYKHKEYENVKKKIIRHVKKNFNTSNNNRIKLNKFISFFHPKIKFGNITSLNLLEIDELIIFKFYINNAKRYKRFVDIGANIGVHSIINSKLGLEVLSYEPDPWHMKLLKKNITKNKINVKKTKLFQCAVSNKDKTSSFTRVLGNTTGSHITGSKKDVYNKIKKFNVKVISATKIVKKNDLVKIDAEGEEAKIIGSLKKTQLQENDFICEIGNEKNAKIIFKKLKKLNIASYSQKNNFKIVKKINDFPVTYKEGSLLISSKNRWKI